MDSQVRWTMSRPGPHQKHSLKESYTLPCIPQKKFESVVVFLALCYPLIRRTKQRKKSRGYGYVPSFTWVSRDGPHQTDESDADGALNIRHTTSLPSQCSVQCSVLRALKRFFLSFASLLSIILSLISARTYKHGGFCLKTGAPQRGKSSFSLKRVW